MAPRKRSRKKKGGGILSTAIGILFASVMAVFLGYVVGQIGIRAITKPLFTEDTTQSTQREETRSGNGKVNEPAPSTSQPNAPQKVQVSSSVNEPQLSAAKSATPSTQASDNNGRPAPVTTRPGAQSVVSAQVPAPAKVPAPTSASQRKTVAPPDDLAVPALASPRPQEGDLSTSAQESSLWRVRIGRFSNKAEADALLVQVKAYVSQAFLVREGTYRVQAGAFGDKAKAEALQVELMRQGFAAELIGPTY